MPSDWKAQWAGARAQLRALDYDAPAVPDVDDAMQALYLTAGGNESGDPIKGPIPVPPAVRDEAMRALRMAHKHNYGAWNFIGVARAIQLAVVPRIGQKSVDRMRAFFTRHAKDANAPHFGDNKRPSRGYLAHLVWGGDPAKTWVMDTEEQMRKFSRRNPNDLERALEGSKHLSNANLTGADLRGANLSRAYLIGAGLTEANLSRANLSGTNLTGADLTEANLTNADLREAHLYGAFLRGANLSNADLSGANLRVAYLRGTDLSDAHLTHAVLRGTDLSGANLTGADLRGADLTNANLSGANLSGANLSGANLTDADLSEALNVDKAIGIILPKAESARSLGRMTGAILKAEKPDAPQRAADFKRRYPAEFERLKGDTQGRDLAPALRSSLRKKYETPFDWHITVGEYESSAQRYCPTANRVLMFNLDLNDPQYTPRQKEFLAKLREVSTRSGHPSAKKPYFTVGWVRLCANEEAQTVLIEEVQSDVSVVRKKLKDGSAPEGLQAYADVLADFAPIAERFYADAIGYVFTEAEKQGYTVEMLDYAAKQGFGSPRELYTDLPRSMGMRLGDVSRVVPKVGKTWSYKPNPKKSGVKIRKEQAPKEPKPDKAGTNLFKDKPPPYRGSFRGESITVEVKIETGKFRYIPTTPQQRAKMKAEGKEPREVVRIPILRSEIVTYWIWSGSEWLRPDVFLVRYAEQIKKERLLPHEGEISKFDVSGIGELIRGRTRHEAAPPKPREKKSSLRPGPSDPKERRRLAKILQMFSPDDED